MLRILIGGLIVGDAARSAQSWCARLRNAGVTEALADPLVDLFDANGAILRSNDNWKDSQRVELEAIGVQPSDDLEAALVITLAPDNYTAVVRDKNGDSGVGLVEVYNVP